MTQLAVRAAVCFMVCVVGASDGCESGLGVLRSTSQATPLAFPLTEDVGEQRQGRTRRDAPTVCGGLKVLEIVGYRVSLSHRSSSFLERLLKFVRSSRQGRGMAACMPHERNQQCMAHQPMHKAP